MHQSKLTEHTLNLDRKRWQVLIAGIFVNLCAGAAYVFSIFEVPLRSHLGCSKPEFALAFSLSIGFLPVGMLLSGRIADRGNPRLAVAAGGTLYGLGILLTGSASSTAWLYATYGVMGGIGNGAAYGAVVGAAVKWFPDRRGMASGLVVSALGIGTVLIAPLAQWMIDSPAIGALGAFKVLGASFIVTALAASIFIVMPPKNYRPAGMSSPDQANAAIAEDMPWNEMLKRLRFWHLFVIYTCGTFSGLMVVSQASAIAQEITGLGAAAAALVVGSIGLANSAGRFLWGAWSDRIGRFEALSLMFLVTGAVMLSLSVLASAVPTLVAAYLLVALCYGGYLGIFPSICADAFGSRGLTVNYALLFAAFSLAGVLGPRVGAVLRASTGRYTEAFVTAGAIACVGLVLSLIARFSDSTAVSETPPTT